MKKFFSLMLAVLLLVSALPFQAFASGTSNDTVNVPVTLIFEKLDGSETRETYTANGLNKQSYMISGIATYVKSGWASYFKAGGSIKAYDVHGTNQKGNSDASVDVSTATQIFIRIKENVCTHANQETTNTATCTTGGLKTVKCKTCGEVLSETQVAAGGHSLDNGVVTKEATCKEAGVKTFSCANCDYTKTESIAKLTEHTYDANNICTVCGLQRYVLNFFNEKGTNEMKIVCSGDLVTAPTADLVPNYEFKGWYEGPNGYGRSFTTGSAWTAGMPTNWYAWYVYNPAKDGTSTITITARCYIDGIGTSYRDVPVLTVDLPDNTNVFDWLTANKNTTILTSVYNKVDTTKYEWKDRFFYNHNGSEVLTAQTVFADGPKSILIKLDEKDNTTRANVQLYLHKSSTSADPFRILDMNGYTSGMNVTRDAAAKLVKEYYSYSSIGNLYTDANWNALQRGENAYGATSIAITDNGTYKIHVVVSNASTKSNSNADTTNPKTGDYIMIAVGTMVLAAAAVITLAEMKKRKMI